jgi:hypothetical protein
VTGPEQTVQAEMRDRRRNGVVWLAVALILAITLGVAYKSDKRSEAQDRMLAESSAQVAVNGRIAQEAKAGVEEANRRLRAAGKPTVPVPSTTPVSPPVTTEVESVSVEQVRAIVVTELARSKAQLTQAEISQIARVAASMVPRPKDGRTPTKAEIQPMVTVAVASYCLEGRCTGKPGRDGNDGKDGRDGVDGKDAPKVTDEQLLAAAQQALQAYCAQESQPCRGADGTDGKDGVDGKDGTDGKDGVPGRGIADSDCQEDGTWLISYTDGTTDTARGPCRVVPPPVDPTPAAKKSR